MFIIPLKKKKKSGCCWSSPTELCREHPPACQAWEIPQIPDSWNVFPSELSPESSRLWPGCPSRGSLEPFPSLGSHSHPWEVIPTPGKPFPSLGSHSHLSQVGIHSHRSRSLEATSEWHKGPSGMGSHQHLGFAVAGNSARAELQRSQAGPEGSPGDRQGTQSIPWGEHRAGDTGLDPGILQGCSQPQEELCALGILTQHLLHEDGDCKGCRSSGGED